MQPDRGVSGDRRSSREPRPPAQWKEEEAPLLKWEREQRSRGQQKGARGRSGSGRAAGDGTYETDSEDQLASQAASATSLLNTDALMLPDLRANAAAKLGRVMWQPTSPSVSHVHTYPSVMLSPLELIVGNLSECGEVF